CQCTSPGAGTPGCTATPWVPHPDNMDVFFRTGLTVTNTVAVSGGSDRAYGRVSLGGDNVDGVFPNNDFRRRSAGLSGTFHASDRFTADGSVEYVYNSGKNRTGTGYWGRNPLENYIWLGRQVDFHALAYNTDLSVTGERRLSDWLHVNALVGGNQRREYFHADSQQTAGIVVPEIYNPANAAIAPTIGQRIERRWVNSLYGSAAFTLFDWWTVEGTGRNDWSSTLPAAARSYFYPSVNTSVLLTDALPRLRSRVFDAIKLRASIARVGNDAPVYKTQPVYIGNANKFNGQPQFSLDSVLANANLKPEITTSEEVGAELVMLRNRVTLDASWYHKSTRDQIFNVQIPPTSGFTSKFINAGELSNRGIEALLTVTPLQVPGGITWTS